MKEVIDLRHQLHACAELSLQETETKSLLMSRLRKIPGLYVEDRGRWFFAAWLCDTPHAPAIAFRADMDALPMEDRADLAYRSRHPGVSHRCGHDGHCAALAALAGSVAEEKPAANVYFIFQHAEEIGAGGEACARLIPEKGIQAVYAFHNWSGFPENSVALREGIVQCASRGLTLRFLGSPAHASQPEDGINPVSALARLALETESLLKNTPWRGMTMATVVHLQAGARDFGIAASRGEISMTLRAFYDEDMARLFAGIRDLARSLADTYGLSWETEDSDVFPATVNHPGETRRIARIAEEAGLSLIRMDQPFRSSEDFGYYQQQCPGVIFYVGNGEKWPQIHTEGYDFNDRILPAVLDIFHGIIREHTL